MNNTEQDRIDQALFGYSEGHRQIAASVKLPAGDLYRLSAASDLATGIKLALNESYITGVPLEESKRYALIRTWLAPELSRPGCVWSHVLLLDAKVLSARANLHDLLQCFRRPNDDAETYAVPTVLRLGSSEPTEIDEIELRRAIQNYYSGRPAILSARLSHKKAEAIVTAMWSQQWPKLRARFAFRTAPAEPRRSDLFQYDVQLGSASPASGGEGDTSEWAVVAAHDAAKCQVTNLRRFLWRYGRDISVARSSYRMLVELFVFVQKRRGISVEQVLRIFRSLSDPSDGEILKKDVLGIPSGSPPLLDTISLLDLLEVLSDQKESEFVFSAVSLRLQDLDGVSIGDVARYLDLNYDAMTPWKVELENAIVKKAEASTLSESFPRRLWMMVLRARPDLVVRDTVALLTSDELVQLLDLYPVASAEDPLVREAVRRDFGIPKIAELVRKDPVRFFLAALDARVRKELSAGWESVWQAHLAAILATGWPREESSWSRVASGLVMLGYPRHVGLQAKGWVFVLSSIQDDLRGDDRARFQGYLLQIALSDSEEDSWKLCALVFPDLQKLILTGKLPDDVHEMLLSSLPRYNTASYWDVNRRVLICLSFLRKKVRNADAENALCLSASDREVLITGAANEEDSKRFRFWWF